jgi:hypothetical protein
MPEHNTLFLQPFSFDALLKTGKIKSCYTLYLFSIGVFKQLQLSYSIDIKEEMGFRELKVPVIEIRELKIHLKSENLNLPIMYVFIL